MKMARGTPDFFNRTFVTAANDEQIKLSVTSSNSTATFSQIVAAFIIYNDGPNAIFVENDAAATTSKFKLPARAWLMLDIPTTTVQCICESGNTATAYLWGFF